MPVDVKICGLTTAEALDAAVEGGARYVGFVFYERSPRALDPEQAARLAARVPAHVRKVALIVDADDVMVERVVAAVMPDLLQCHGREAPARIAELRQRFGLPVIKTVSIAGPEDLEQASAYECVADMLLFDAKPPAGDASALPGGNGLAFDWQLIAERRHARPWLLAGGLTAENLAEAVNTSGARVVDVSSGVEDAPGHKDPEAIARFLAASTAL